MITLNSSPSFLVSETAIPLIDWRLYAISLGNKEEGCRDNQD